MQQLLDLTIKSRTRSHLSPLPLLLHPLPLLPLPQLVLNLLFIETVQLVINCNHVIIYLPRRQITQINTGPRLRGHLAAHFEVMIADVPPLLLFLQGQLVDVFLAREFQLKEKEAGF